MFEIVVETEDFVLDYAREEISKFTSEKVLRKEDKFVIKFEYEKDAYDFVLNVIYFSRLIQRIYLKKGKELVDLVGFDLIRRDYKLYRNSDALSSLIVNFCFYELGLDKEKSLKIIDPLANLGDIVIESAIFNPIRALNVAKRHSLPISDYFDEKPFLPKNEKVKNKIVGVVQDNLVFKQIKENINFANVKVKLSQYELDWLDVKFKEGDFDYCISYLRDMDYLQEFLYMAEFISKKKICVISNGKILKSAIKKFNLKVDKEISVKLYNKNYYINIFTKV